MQPGLGGVSAPNALQGQGGSQVGAQAPFDLVKNVEAGYAQAQAQHSKLLESMKRLEVVRTGLDSLGKLGDQVTPEDVIKTAGAMVGAGFAPQALAQLLSSMPGQGGEALQAWVLQQDEQVRQMEQQMAGAFKQSAITTGIAAGGKLHLHHAQGRISARMAQQAPMPGEAPNELEGTS